MKKDFDLVVIGAGPAGESTAINAAKHGLRVAIIERRQQVGGSCTHMGTIPSKALRSGVINLMQAHRNPLLRTVYGNYRVEYPQLLRNMAQVVNQQVDMRQGFYRRNNIEVIHGLAVFSDSHTVRVQLDSGGETLISSHYFVIATGSRPYQPPEIDFNQPGIFDSDSILAMDHHPGKVIIYGAGVIGCEYASIFSGMGIKCELINTRNRLLEFLDDEISDALSYHLRDYGVMVRHRERFVSVDHEANQVIVSLASGKRIVGDVLLWCNGRSGNSDNLQLDQVGLTPDHRGHIGVDNHYRTSVEHIYAVGDIIGWPSLASASYNQGQVAAAHILGADRASHVDDVPTGIYTIPEISSVGKTERELTENCMPFEVGRAFFKDTARGQLSGQTVGMLKLLFHPQSYQILGVHCFGREATEIIHIGQAIMSQPEGQNDIRYFTQTTFNYPTMAEAYRIAALNGLNRLLLQ